MAFICLYLPCQPRETFLIERIIETKEGNEDEMFPDRWKERSICEENENIWKRIPGEKLPKFVGEMETFYWQASMTGNNCGLGGNDCV